MMKINKINSKLHFIGIFLGYEKFRMDMDVFYNRKFQRWLFYNSTDAESLYSGNNDFNLEYDKNGNITNAIFTPLINGHIIKESYFVEKEFRQVDLLDLEELNLSQKIQVNEYREYLEKRKTEAIDSKNKNNYLGLPTTENGEKLFEYLIENYRPTEKTPVKFVNILHYLKNDADKKLYIFKVKQKPDYVNLIKSKIGIEIKKFAKSPKYDTIDKPILNQCEYDFRQNKSLK